MKAGGLFSKTRRGAHGREETSRLVQPCFRYQICRMPGGKYTHILRASEAGPVSPFSDIGMSVTKGIGA